MRSTLTIVVLLTMFAAKAQSADPATPPHHSVVNLVFVIPITTSKQEMIDAGEVPRAHVGNLVAPLDQISPISISIDSQFVGHALGGGWSNIHPKFVLESGTHEFSFSCPGFVPQKKKLKVIGSGSNQYLVIRMQNDSVQKGQNTTTRQIEQK